MMRHLHHLALAFLVLAWGACAIAAWPGPALAEEVACPADNKPDMDIEFVFEQPQQDFSVNLKQIQTLYEQTSDSKISSKPSRGGASSENTAHTLGLTTGTLVMEQSSHFAVRQIGPNKACVYLMSLKVVFGFRGHMVYVARELPRRSCPFNEVMGHEKKHIETDRKLLSDKMEWVKSEITKAVEKAGRVEVGPPEILQKELRERLYNRLEPVHQTVLSERRQRQEMVDSAAEYQRVSRTCEGKTQEIVNHFFQSQGRRP